jgi:beta-lactamase regulating signal transducer with metallopeptidase domain
VLGTLWLAGAVLVLCMRLAAWWQWRRARRPGAAPADLQWLVDNVASALGVVAPQVHVDATLRAPVVTGVLRPRLWWPALFRDTLAEEGARTVLAHELAHIRRGDVRLSLIELANDCIWWWYPGWYVVRRHLRDASERACDVAVVGAYPRLRRAYAESLLDVAGIHELSPRPGVGLAANGRAVRRRLQSIMRGDSFSRTPTARAVTVLFAMLVLPAWSVNPSAGEVAPMLSLSHEQDLAAVLARAAADEAPDVRRAAANALREVDSVEAEAVLRTMVDDADADVRHAARSALGRIAARVKP